MAYVGARLRELRKAHQLTQDQLAAGTGIPRTDLSAIENDRISLGPARAAILAEALGVSVLELQPEAEPDQLGLTLLGRQEALEGDLRELIGQVDRLVAQVEELERRVPPGAATGEAGAE